MKFMHEQERQHRVAVYMSSVRSLLIPDEAPQTTTNELRSASLNVLIKGALEIGGPLLAIYSSLSLHPAEGKAACDDLLARGYMSLLRLPKGRGGQMVVIEPLSAGKEELVKRGIEPAKPHLRRGGFRHAVYGEYLGKWAVAQRLSHWWERTLGVKAFDFVYEEEGKLFAVEVCLSGTAEWTAQQALKGASVAGIHQLIVACERKPFLDAVMKETHKIDELGLYRDKIVGKLLAEYLP